MDEYAHMYGIEYRGNEHMRWYFCEKHGDHKSENLQDS